MHLVILSTSARSTPALLMMPVIPGTSAAFVVGVQCGRTFLRAGSARSPCAMRDQAEGSRCSTYALRGRRQAVVEPDDRERMLHDELLNSNDLFPPRFRLSLNSAFLVVDSHSLFRRLRTKPLRLRHVPP